MLVDVHRIALALFAFAFGLLAAACDSGGDGDGDGDACRAGLECLEENDGEAEACDLEVGGREDDIFTYCSACVDSQAADLCSPYDPFGSLDECFDFILDVEADSSSQCET